MAQLGPFGQLLNDLVNGNDGELRRQFTRNPTRVLYQRELTPKPRTLLFEAGDAQYIRSAFLRDNARAASGVGDAPKPGEGATEPDGGTTKPGEGTTEPDGGTTKPDTGGVVRVSKLL